MGARFLRFVPLCVTTVGMTHCHSEFVEGSGLVKTRSLDILGKFRVYAYLNVRCYIKKQQR